MSNYPNSFDDDTTLPPVNDNLDQIGGDAINGTRDAILQIEQALGTNIAGSAPDLATRLGVSINPDGTLKASVIFSLGLVVLPITNNQIADDADILESKLHLDHRTQDLFNYIRDLSRDVNLALGWISVTGVKLEPHLIGAIYRHDMSQIDVAEVASEFLNNKFRINRDNTNSYTLVNDINNELLAHQWADGSQFGTIQNVITNDGSSYPSNYAHVASGIFVDTSRFQTIPQTDQDVQSTLEFIDQSSNLLLGSRVQNLYANGISVNSRSSSLLKDGYGQPIIPVTPATAYLLNNGTSSSPVDNINTGDDIIQFNPSSSDMSSNSFDEKFALVRVGDIIRVNYGTVEVPFVISEIKYNQSGPNKTYLVRIAGKNIAFTTNAQARIDRPLFNNNKFGVLATAITNNAADSPITTPPVPASLIVGSPRGAQTVGVGFNPDQFDSTHYLLYLALYPTGNPNDGFTILPGIDVTGNQGLTPGSYTLDSIVDATNAAFRKPGFNYRFIAFESNGEFGIMLADSYNNAAFSILNMIVTAGGTIDTVQTAINFPNNVLGNVTTTNLPDPLGFGILGANIASPPFQTSYGSPEAAQFPTRLFVPLRKNSYYVSGAERERLNLQNQQILDTFGDGYWVATIDNEIIIPGPSGHVQTTYKIPLDLSNTDLKIGKTIVVQSLGSGSLTDFGRFVITNINFEDGPPTFTEITVYDAVHAVGHSPAPTLPPNDGYVAIYFNSDSVSFDNENASDFVTPSGASFKRFFEIYTDQNGATYSHERGRLNTSGSNITVNNATLFSSLELSHVNLAKISPTLRGYRNSGITKINLQIFSYDIATGLFDGYLCNFDGINITNAGPITVGQKGQPSRFYDESNVDYIDIVFAANDPVPQIVSPKNIDIQLFPTLSLDQEIMLLSTCQFNDANYQVSYLKDARQFGNISKEQLTTSAIDFIRSSDKELHENGIIRGFDITHQTSGTISFSGGVALVNGKIVEVDPQTVDIPIVKEALPIVPEGNPTIVSTVNVITWFICVNDKAEIELVASTDFDPFGPFISQYSAAALNHLRLFYVMNPNAVSPTPYQIRGTYFAGLVINQKDVTPIATVVSTVTNPGSGYVVTNMIVNDAKRFVTNGYGGLTEPLTLGTFASFRNIDSLINWLFQLNNLFSASVGEANPISNKVIVKGHVPITTTVPLGYIFGEITFEGDNGVFDVATPTGFDVHSNVHFNNIIFNYLFDPAVYSTPGYVASDLINTGHGTIHMGVTTFDRNVSITDCHFIWVPLIAGLAPVIGAPIPPTTSTGINRFSFINIEMVNPATAPGSPPNILQSVDISRNTFIENTLNTFIPQNQETTRAAIAFVSTSTTSTENVVGNGLKLIDITIRDNVCDKDQMIAVVPTYATSTTTVANTFNVTSFVIENNTCGAISVLTQYDTPASQNFTANFINFTLDKNNGLIIKGNTCKYITSTESTGTDIAMNGSSILPSTGPMIISDNACSWIKLPLQVNPGFDLPSPCVIKNNVLRAYDTNFRKNYLQGTTTGLTNTAIEIFFVGATDTTNVTIHNNWIDDGVYVTISPPTSIFAYDNGIFTAHDADIGYNYIANLAPALFPLIAPTGITVSSLSSNNVHCNIHHNKLYRNGINWSAYIFMQNDLNHEVVDNFFDNPSRNSNPFDVLNQVTTSSVVFKSNVTRNINQTVFEAFSLVDYNSAYLTLPLLGGAASPTGPAARPTVILFDPATNFFFQRFTQTGSVASSSMYGLFGEVVQSAVTPAFRDLSFTIPLSDQLPPGVRIVSIKMGAWLQINSTTGASLDFTSLGGTANNAITLSLVKSNPFANISPTGVLNVKANVIPGPLPSLGTDLTYNSFDSISETLLIGATPSSGSGFEVVTQAQAQAVSPLLILGNDATPLTDAHYTISHDYRLNIQVDINFLRSTSGTNGDTIVWYLSPVLVEYRW